MLFIQKLISNLFLSPSLFIIFLLFLSLIVKKNYIERKLLQKIFIFLSVFIYIISIDPVKDMFLKPLERKYKVITKEKLLEGDVYILLGSGIFDNAPMSFGENGIPSETAMVRIVETLRLYKISPKKIILSGGKTFGNKNSEAEVYKKFLVSMGVDSNDVLLEDESRTTAENSNKTKVLFEENYYKKGIVVTSASHMPRAVKSFERNGINVIEAPCGYNVGYNNYGINAFLPKASNIELLRRAVWEYMGYIYYSLRQV